MSRPRLIARDLTKTYRRVGRRGRLSSLKGALLSGDLLSGLGAGEAFTALEGLDLRLDPGEAVAIIGPNGSGKSTLLKLISGILQPTRGELEVDGRVTALIELGAGFHPELSGRENVTINGMLLGLERSQIDERLDEIVAFAGLGDFIDQPVKSYSSGMYVRLGFAVAVAADPELLLIDEVLAVGDEAFTRKCLHRIAELRRQGVSMILVSHDLDLVQTVVDRAVYLKRGRLIAEGPPDVVVARYRSDVADDDEIERGEVVASDDGQRWGDGAAVISSVEFASGGIRLRVVPHGADLELKIRFRVEQRIADAVYGLAWHRLDGTHVGGHNTEIDGLEPESLEVGVHEVVCRYERLELAPGTYSVDVAIHSPGGHAYDYRCGAARLEVTAAHAWPGIWAPQHAWQRVCDEDRCDRE